MQIKSSADNFELNYCYRADGGKFSALDADKTGLIYIGSLVYKQTAGSKIEFESAAFSDGRFRRNTHSWNTNYAPEYYLKDHLGSPRAFVDWSGELIALRDYYAFGKSWQKPNSPATWDLSRFNGKEEQPVGDVGLLDYGARFYHPDLGRWLTQDPMAEKIYDINPYNFCINNPIKYVDWFGLSAKKVVDDYIVKIDGRVIRKKTEDPFDRFYVENENGELSYLATLDKIYTSSDITLVCIPDSGFGYDRYGNVDPGGDHYVQPAVAAVLLAVAHKMGSLGVILQFGDMSGIEGNKPGTEHNGGSMSHVNGRNVDIRYVRTDRKLLPVTVYDATFDVNMNQKMVDYFYHYGFKSILSHTNSDGILLNHTKNYPNHHHHIHLQGFNPIIITK